MDWLLQHLQLLIAAAGGVAWWLNKRRQSRDNPPAKPGREVVSQDDPGLAERTRRIREEIQRKIGERARGEVPSAPQRQTRPKPILRTTPPQRSRAEPPPLARSGMTREEAARSTEMLAKQAALAEQLRQAVEIKTAALRRIRSGSETLTAERVSTPVRAAVVDDLRDVAALRRAFVLREIIGPPVALR